jgi:hypothetical protein
MKAFVIRAMLFATVCAACLALFVSSAFADQSITAVNDYEFTLNGQNFYLHAGETFTETGDNYVITDSSGQVIAQGSFGGGAAGQAGTTSVQSGPAQPEYWFFAIQDGYDVRVGSGFLFLKAGYKYLASAYAQEQIEVREISTDALVGHALLIELTADNGGFAGFETPVATIDTNGDGLVSPGEMDASLLALEQKASALGQAAGSSLTTGIATARATQASGAIAQAYTQIKDLQASVAKVQTVTTAASTPTTAGQPSAAQADDETSTSPVWYVVIGVVVLVVLCAVGLVLRFLRTCSRKRAEQGI